jgi:hypothetical protein
VTQAQLAAGSDQSRNGTSVSQIRGQEIHVKVLFRGWPQFFGNDVVL